MKVVENSLKNRIVEISKNNNGTHFVQKVILCFDISYLDFVYTPVIDNIVELGNDCHGLCVLKQLMSKYKFHVEKSKKIIELLSLHNDILIQSPFGNYAIQHAFECYGEEHC